MNKCLLAIVILFAHFSASAAVILQYHHVSDTTPKSTSITPTQFEAHLQFLKDNQFTVVPLSSVIDKVKQQTPLTDKTVVITFDDAYIDILTNAKPLLDKFNYPFTIFVNPGVIERNSSSNLTWQQLKTMADEGVIIANHGFEHDSLARIPDNMPQQQWLEKQGELLNAAEKMIEEKTGQSWRYFAYPYGEYTPEIQQWVRDNDFIAFSQQSGAVGLNTDLTSIPRFPASMPYDKISSLRDKLNALPFDISLDEYAAKTLFNHKEATSVTIDLVVDDFYKSQLNCYISGLGRQKIKWQGDESFSMTFSKPLPTGRVRSNCTAPSINKPGRYYWYSKPWFVLKEDGSWYPL
ncbi:polysaccharide deacetylase family protein [Thalassotalea sp. PLHSN55]|uniref:polysaccharide deacetylase family protein n=1 Tax=Thalassotalea sp. PLHSN55 TaxID=3435888 RepID=UPI003F87BFC2